MTGFFTLLHKELTRFWKVSLQTILAPIVASLLYLLIFSHILSAHIDVYPDVSYPQFLIPGLVMMAIIQNAFANSSSSLIQSKISGNLIFVLLSPLSHLEIFFAYILASITRGLLVGTGVLLVTLLFYKAPLHNLLWVMLFAIMGGGLLGALGVIAGIWAEKLINWLHFKILLFYP